ASEDDGGGDGGADDELGAGLDEHRTISSGRCRICPVLRHDRPRGERLKAVRKWYLKFWPNMPPGSARA
ncbi:MAG: hypothetical protein ACLGIA_10735, partial [Actinomycetes bacterium]